MQKMGNQSLPARRQPRPAARHDARVRRPVSRRHPWNDAWRVQSVGIDGEYSRGEAASQLASGLLAGAARAGLFVLGLVARALGEAFDHKS